MFALIVFCVILLVTTITTMYSLTIHMLCNITVNSALVVKGELHPLFAIVTACACPTSTSTIISYGDGMTFKILMNKCNFQITVTLNYKGFVWLSVERMGPSIENHACDLHGPSYSNLLRSLFLWGPVLMYGNWSRGVMCHALGACMLNTVILR